MRPVINLNIYSVLIQKLPSCTAVLIALQFFLQGESEPSTN